MLKPLKTLLVAGGLALGLSGFAATNAQAGQTALTFGSPDFSITIGSGVQPVRHWHRDRGFRRGVCNPRRALRKAHRRGLNRPHVQRINRKRIVVAGWSRGERIVMGMGRHRSCPVHFVRERGHRWEPRHTYRNDRHIGRVDPRSPRYELNQRRRDGGGRIYSGR